MVRRAKDTRLTFDLSALPRGAVVRHASLFCFTEGNRQPRTPASIYVGGKVGASVPLKLEAPWYRSFDATGAVQRCGGRVSPLRGEGQPLKYKIAEAGGGRVSP